MNYNYQTILMQTQASGKSYQQYLEEQLAQCCCSLAVQEQTALIQQETQRILSPSEYSYIPPLITLDKIQQLFDITSQRVTMECCCDDGSSLKPKKTNCVNCGAALRGKHRCIYCDTYNE